MRRGPLTLVCRVDIRARGKCYANGGNITLVRGPEKALVGRNFACGRGRLCGGGGCEKDQPDSRRQI